jgi:multidrug transporter EmrE-like cation transporter
MSFIDLTSLSLTEIIGDFGYSNYADTGSLGGFLQGTVGYIGVVFFLIRSLKQGNVMYVNGMWDGISGIIETIAAYLILGNRLTHWLQYIGIIMIGIGLVFLKTMGGSGK